MQSGKLVLELLHSHVVVGFQLEKSHQSQVNRSLEKIIDYLQCKKE